MSRRLPETATDTLPPLTAQQEEFCQQYQFDRNGTAAAQRAGLKGTYASTKKRASEWMALPQVRARIAELEAERRERLKLKADEFVDDLVEMLRVDINEIVEHRVINCRHCWGVDHKYQWTPAEFARETERYDAMSASTRRNKPRPTDAGGLDYDQTRAPNPQCSECRGVGLERLFFKDTRTLSPAARRLYDGMKIGKDGKQVLLVGKDKLLDMLAKALGVNKEKVEHSGAVTINFDRADSDA